MILQFLLFPKMDLVPDPQQQRRESNSQVRFHSEVMSLNIIVEVK